MSLTVIVPLLISDGGIVLSAGQQGVRVQGQIYCDPTMEDGYFMTGLDQDGDRAYMCTSLTYQVLSANDLLVDVLDELDKRPPGTHLIPRKCLEPDKAEDVQRAVDYMSSNEDIRPMSSNEDIPTCSLPHCQQDGTDTSRGFPLCADDAALLQDWDDLVVA